MLTANAAPAVTVSAFYPLIAASNCKWFAYATPHPVEAVLSKNYFLGIGRLVEPGDRIEVTAEVDTDEPRFLSLYVKALQTRVGELRAPVRHLSATALAYAGYRPDAALLGIVLQRIVYEPAEPESPPRMYDLGATPKPAAA